jgi:hypothetical protein
MGDKASSGRQEGEPLEPAEPWKSMPNTGEW